MSDTTTLAVRDEAAPTAMERKVQDILPLVGGDRLRAERTIRVAANAISKVPALANADRNKLWLAVQEVVQMGLTFGARGAYLVPYKNDVTVIVSPHGLIELAFRSPLVKAIQARVVHQNDEFSVEYAPEPVIHHKPCIQSDTGPLVACYAIIDLTTGGRVIEWMKRDEVMKTKAVSRSASSPGSPWVQWEAEMWRKTVLKRAMKYVPQSEELMMALAKDDEDSVFENPPQSRQVPSAMQTVKAQLNASAVEEVSEDEADFDTHPA